MIPPPARKDRIRRAALTAACIAALALGTDGHADGPDDWAWKNMEEYIASLATSDSQTKRDLAESALSHLGPLFEAGRDEEDVTRVVDSLRQLLRTEKDDWIMKVVLELHVYGDGDALQPLFLDALMSPSPNLSWYGIQRFSYVECAEALPELRKAWRREERPWVRLDLIYALAKQGSKEDLDDFIELALGPDIDLSVAAIRALATLEDRRAIPALARVVRHGPDAARLAAIEALVTWPLAREAREAVLLASHAEVAEVRERAVRSLASFPGPDAAGRLVELALDPYDDADVRAAAIEGMSQIAPWRAIDVLVGILRKPAPESDSRLHRRVLSELREIDDPSILDALQGFVPRDEEFPSGDLSDLRTYLERDRDTQGKDPVHDFSCSLNFLSTDPDDPNRLVVTPPPWMRSIRCWRCPGVSGDPEDFPRLPAGITVRIDDHFELGGESWVGVSGESVDDCWVPMRFIEHPREQPAEAGEEDTMLIRREFDVPASEAESDIARGLMDAGLLEVIEPGDDVIGVAITVDPGDFDMVFLLARSCGLEETLLDDQIDEIVQQLAPLYPEHPALDRFRRAKVAEPPETDTVIDLDIEELTDH